MFIHCASVSKPHTSCRAGWQRLLSMPTVNLVHSVTYEIVQWSMDFLLQRMSVLHISNRATWEKLQGNSHFSHLGQVTTAWCGSPWSWCARLINNCHNICILHIMWWKISVAVWHYIIVDLEDCMSQKLAHSIYNLSDTKFYHTQMLLIHNLFVCIVYLCFSELIACFCCTRITPTNL